MENEQNHNRIRFGPCQFDCYIYIDILHFCILFLCIFPIQSEYYIHFFEKSIIINIKIVSLLINNNSEETKTLIVVIYSKKYEAYFHMSLS